MAKAMTRPGVYLTLIEFPAMEAAHRWYGSDDYAEALALSQALKRRLIFAPGAETA